jgi:hypothetical protein
MNSLWRIFVGAVIGAMIALVIHPASRPLATMAFVGYGPSKVVSTNALLPENLDVLPNPTDLQAAGLWMQVGADRLRKKDGISENNLRSLIAVASLASDADPENAYWAQMAAVFSYELDQIDAAEDWWIYAGNCQLWNDYQVPRLLRVRRELVAETQGLMGWHSARLSFNKSPAAAREIEQLGSLFVGQSDFSSLEALRLRYATLRNGRLMRLGARSLDIGLFGVSMIEFSALDKRNVGPGSPRKLLTARYQLIDAMRKADMADQALNADNAFNENEGWYYLVERGAVKQETNQLVLSSVAIATLPSALFVSGLVSLLIAGLSALAMQYPVLQWPLQPKVAPFAGAVIALILYGLTQLTFLALATVGCFAFLSFGPSTPRARPSLEMGPLFGLAVTVLGLVMGALFALFLASLMTPTVEVLPKLDIPPEYYGGNTLLLGLAGIVILLTLLIAPLWAIVHRVPTPTVVLEALRRLGINSGVILVGLGVVLIPIGLYFDMQVSELLSQILQNEPNYYLTRWAP